MKNPNDEEVTMVKIVKKRGPKPTENPRYKDPDYNEHKKAYAKEYYAKNRESLLNNLKAPVECKHCHATVCKTNLNYHMQTKLCHKRSKHISPQVIIDIPITKEE